MSLRRDQLVRYFLEGAKPRERWRVGMEYEQMGLRLSDGRRLPYDGDGATVRAVLESYLARRGGRPVYEGHHLIGADGDWGTLSLEPGGQVEWSSPPRESLAHLARDLDAHLEVQSEIGAKLGVRWLPDAVDPETPLDEVAWMPKARYKILAPYLARRGPLAHWMMKQTASIQASFDYADAADWARKFRAAALASPLAVALFANSPRAGGRDTGYRSYRVAIWRRTDPDRCGLPDVVFRPDFDLEAWVDWAARVPAIFRRRARGLVPAGGVPFETLMTQQRCAALGIEDWELHLSSIFTEVRSYTHMEVRSADLQPPELALAVPAFWTGLLYHEDGLNRALALADLFPERALWDEAMEAAARKGMDASLRGTRLGDLAAEILRHSHAGLEDPGLPFAGGPPAGEALRLLAGRHALSLVS